MGRLNRDVIIYLMKNKYVLPILVMIFGILITGSAVFAERLGLDPSTGWGAIRITLLIFGVTMVISAAILWRHIDEARKGARNILSRIENHKVVGSIRRDQSIVYISGLIKKYWFTIPILILVILIYIWFISSGTWITWVSPTHLYADLARGFLKGKLYLPIKVSPNLLVSPDPYDASIGLGLQGPLDVSYFKGKYYLYWGPVPALILFLLHPIISWRLGDLQLLFCFLTGIYILLCLLSDLIWDRYFSNLPKYLLWLSIFLIGLAGPATFMLDHYRGARIYEAAVTGGQFFMVAGFLAVVIYLSRLTAPWRLSFAGIFWALAIGTRLILAAPIGFMVLMTVWWILKSNRRSFEKIKEMFALGVPLALGLVCLGWYNWVRFESVTESGFFYAMTSIPNFQKHSGELFNPIYILQNLYNYFIYPFSIRTQFPYIFAEYGKIKPVFSSYPLPSIYFSQKITGLVYITPFLIFAIIPLVTLFKNLLKKQAVELSSSADDRLSLNWIMLTLGGGGLITFILLMTYFWAAMRYLEDVLPFLVLFAVIGFWQGYQFLSNKPLGRRWYSAFGIILAATSMLMSILVAFSVNDARFVVIRFLSSVK